MILSDTEISRRVASGEIVLSPYNPAHLNPNSYDLTLGSTFLTYAMPYGILDAKAVNTTTQMEIVDTKEGVVLWPGKIYLAHTVEEAGSSIYAPMVEGRSSYARLGLDVHISAGFGDVGFIGQWTLELRVVQPLRIYPQERICQIYFHTVEGQVQKPYVGKYQNSKSAIPSKLHLELNKS